MAINSDFFEAWFGEPFTIQVCLTNCEGTPLDLTGATVSWKIVDYYGGTTLLEVDTVNDPTKIFISDAVNGIVDVSLPSSDIDLIARNCSNFTMRAEFASGDVEVLFNGWQLYIYNR